MRKFIREHGSARGFAETLIFSQNAKNAITPRAISYHLDKIIELAEITYVDKRNLVPYSFRHSFITHMINKGVGQRGTADMCGTSRLQIEKTYYHVTEKCMIENALPKIKYKDGVLVLPDIIKRKL